MNDAESHHSVNCGDVPLSSVRQLRLLRLENPLTLRFGNEFFAHQQQRICFIGHSHRPAMFVEGEGRALDITSLESILPDRKQVINVGSVGQPRDKDERACYLIYRREKQDVWWRRVAYDVSAPRPPSSPLACR